MKITIQHYKTTAHVELEDEGADIYEVGEILKGLLVAVGFHPTSVDELIPTESSWFPDDDIGASNQAPPEKTCPS